ncbi:MAG: hypothetical protein ACTSPY_17860 [Candidatus Helarchaeota archaeon]
MKYRLKLNFYIIISVITLSFILLASSSLIDQVPIINNSAIDMKTSNIQEINNGNFTGIYNKVNITQLAQRLENDPNFNVLNDKFSISSDYNSYVGDASAEFNVTEISYYNTSRIELQIKNISAQPTWKDLENNYSTSFYSFHESSNPRMMGVTFNIKSDYERLESVSFYGRVVYSSGNFSAEIWNRANQWSGTPNTILWKKIMTSEIGVATQWWTIDIGGLNLSKGSYVFVLNGWNLTRTGIEEIAWSYLWDSTLDPTDNINETTVYKRLISWAEEPDIDLSFKYRTTLIDNQNNTLTNINANSINMNLTALGSTIDVPDNGTVIFDNINENSNITCLLKANSSFSVNYTWFAWYYNYTYSTNTTYSGLFGHSNTTWNFNFTITFPNNSYNYSFQAFKLLTPWSLIHAYNDSSKNYDKVSEIIDEGTYYSIQNSSILGESLWLFYFNISMQNVNIYRNSSATFGTDSYYTYGDHLNITGDTSSSSGSMNLTVYDPSGIDTTSDWCANPNADINSAVSFNLTVPNNASTGYYIIQIVWDNNTHSGINQTQICVVNNTLLNFITPNELPSPPQYRYIGELLNLTFFYNDTSLNSFVGISSANCTYKIINLTDSSIVEKGNLSDGDLGIGYYNRTINTLNYQNGSYRFIINASKLYYINQSSVHDFILVYNTSLSNYSSNLNRISIYPESITISVNYSDYISGDELVGDDVSFVVNNSGSDSGSLAQQPNGVYQIQFNSTDYGPGYYMINITCKKQGYENRSLLFYWRIYTANTSFSIQYFNTTQDLSATYSSGTYTILWGDPINITINYLDINHSNVFIDSAIVNVTLSGPTTQTYSFTRFGTKDLYNCTISDTLPVGSYSMTFKSWKSGYEFNETTYTLIISERPTNLTIYVNGTITYNFTLYYGEFITITAFYNDTTRNTGIGSASTNISWNPSFPMTPDATHIGNYTYNFTASPVGTIIFTINSSKTGYQYNVTYLTVNILNHDPVISNILHNISDSMYRNQVMRINATITDIEDVPPNITAYICLNRSDGIWVNFSMTNLSQTFFELNLTLPLLDAYLGALQVYIMANDSNNGKTLTNIKNLTVLNNNPVISNEQSNGTSQMYRSQVLMVNLTGTDVEDTYPDLTAYLCINRSGGWYNTSIGHISGDFYELNFTIPNDDVYLGLTNFYVRLNDTDSGIHLVSLINITILNNNPVISNEQSNGTTQMYRSQVLMVNLTGTDVEDTYPNLTAYLCINRSGGWYNTSISHISGDFYELNFTIPNDDVYLGLTNFYIRLNDTDSSVHFVSLINITILNNNPVISNEQSNGTAQMYRSQVLMVNLTGIDVEDTYPNLTAYLCINRSGGWYNTSISHISGDFYELNFTIPNDDLYPIE